jgi:hypothetical protein
MIRRDITPQWQAIVDCYWTRYPDDYPDISIWEMLRQDHGLIPVRPMSVEGWTLVDFPDEKSYNWFLLRWSCGA